MNTTFRVRKKCGCSVAVLAGWVYGFCVFYVCEHTKVQPAVVLVRRGLWVQGGRLTNYTMPSPHLGSFYRYLTTLNQIEFVYLFILLFHPLSQNMNKTYSQTKKLCPLDIYVCQFHMYERISFKFSPYKVWSLQNDLHLK